jgi:RNA polymerase sigma-70 factor (ECF subfamily)
MAKKNDEMISGSDEELLSRLACDDECAFEVLYRRHWAQLFEKAYKRLKSREQAEEVVQDIFTALWHNRNQIEINHSFVVYIHSALKYQVIGIYRSNEKKEKHLNMIQEQNQYEYQVEEALLYQELNAAVEAEVDRLPSKCKEAFNLSRKEHLSFKEIAEEMEISVNTVEKHIGKALRILRTNLKGFITLALPNLIDLL